MDEQKQPEDHPLQDMIGKVIDTGKLPIDVDKLTLRDNDVCLVYFGAPLKDDCDSAVNATAELRAKFPKVTFVFLPDNASLENIRESDMNKLGWYKRQRGSGLQKGERRKWKIENGKLVKK